MAWFSAKAQGQLYLTLHAEHTELKDYRSHRLFIPVGHPYEVKFKGSEVRKLVLLLQVGK